METKQKSILIQLEGKNICALVAALNDVCTAAKNMDAVSSFNFYEMNMYQFNPELCKGGCEE